MPTSPLFSTLGTSSLTKETTKNIIYAQGQHAVRSRPTWHLPKGNTSLLMPCLHWRTQKIHRTFLQVHRFKQWKNFVWPKWNGKEKLTRIPTLWGSIRLKEMFSYMLNKHFPQRQIDWCLKHWYAPVLEQLCCKRYIFSQVIGSTLLRKLSFSFLKYTYFTDWKKYPSSSFTRLKTKHHISFEFNLYF